MARVKVRAMVARDTIVRVQVWAKLGLRLGLRQGVGSGVGSSVGSGVGSGVGFRRRVQA